MHRFPRRSPGSVAWRSRWAGRSQVGRRGVGVDVKSKKDMAVEFINAIRTMDPGALNGLILREAGEDLAQFFLSYSGNLIQKDPSRVLENTSSLMLMGYLIRMHEEKSAGHQSGLPQGYARA